MSCYPPYSYVPTFTPSSVSCVAPSYSLHRSRVSIPASSTRTALFFRSKFQSNDANNIEIEIVSTPIPKFNIYFEDNLVKSYNVTLLVPGSIAALRQLIQNTDPNPYIEMPPVSPDVEADIYDIRVNEPDGDGVLVTGLDMFARCFLTGGSGAPNDASLLASIRTGPSRTIYIVRSRETIDSDLVPNDGSDVIPSNGERIQQWNGTNWYSYCNNVQGFCPLNGTC